MGGPFLAQAFADFLKSAVVLVPVGEEARIRLPGQQPIAEAFSPSDRVAQMLGAEGHAIVKVKGRSPGFNPLVLTDRTGKSKLFLIVVPKPNK